MAQEKEHICPVCGTKMELWDFDGYEKSSHDYDTPPDFITTWEQYRCPECGELLNIDLEDY